STNCGGLCHFANFATGLGVSHNSQGVQEPADSPVGLAVNEVMAYQQLINEDGREDLGTVVIQAAVPDTILQFEQRFQPLVERFGGFFSPSVQDFAFLALQILAPLGASATSFRSHVVHRHWRYRPKPAEETPCSLGSRKRPLRSCSREPNHRVRNNPR